VPRPDYDTLYITRIWNERRQCCLHITQVRRQRGQITGGEHDVFVGEHDVSGDAHEISGGAHDVSGHDIFGDARDSSLPIY
jgi:hypothetical protein